MSYRVQIPKAQWTPFRNEVFAEKLGDLEENRAAALYVFLYDRAYHRPSKAVATTVRELSRWLNMDPRVVQKCLHELSKNGLIRKIRSGVPRSRINKDVWKVPLSAVDLKEDSWTPIPRVLIQKYLPADPNAVLLPVLLYHQHLSWNNYCWVGVTTIRKRLNWSASRVRDSLRSMFDENAWYSLHPDLQWPLRRILVKNDKGERRRHFKVRAVHYDRTGKKPFIRLSAAFQNASKTGV
jgi:hypothetical protein